MSGDRRARQRDALRELASIHLEDASKHNKALEDARRALLHADRRRSLTIFDLQIGPPYYVSDENQWRDSLQRNEKSFARSSESLLQSIRALESKSRESITEARRCLIAANKQTLGERLADMFWPVIIIQAIRSQRSQPARV